MIDKLKVANKKFNSRLIVGTGKYKICLNVLSQLSFQEQI